MYYISIHALLAESDLWVLRKVPILGIFLSTLSLRRATFVFWTALNRPLFLSTLSLRRATADGGTQQKKAAYFYPRSPCGERRICSSYHCHSGQFLSTLSLRRATFSYFQIGNRASDISIHALLAESDFESRFRNRQSNISIHALLAESDSLHLGLLIKEGTFLSTLSLRRATVLDQLPVSVHHNFYPRSPCGERLPDWSGLIPLARISIHALLAESDLSR